MKRLQVENALKGMKAISNAVVIPIREKETKFCVPFAAVVYHPGSEDTTQNIQEYFNEEFAFTKENPIMASLYVPQVVRRVESRTDMALLQMSRDKLTRKSTSVLSDLSNENSFFQRRQLIKILTF